MRRRKTNMLEAWKASHDAPSQAPPSSPAPVQRAPRTKTARGSPLSPGEGLSPGGGRLPGGPINLALSPLFERVPVFLVLTLVALGLLGGAFWLGRSSVRSELRAGAGAGLASPGAETHPWAFPDPAEIDPTPDPRAGAAPGASVSGASVNPRGAPASTDAPRAVPGPVPAGSALEEQWGLSASGGGRAPLLELDAEGRTADDRAFYDKTNRFTVRAIYYGNTPKGWKRALAAYRYLRGQGLPTIAPIDQGDIIVLCVGAEPKREGRLAELREHLRGLPGPPPASERGAFVGAYFINIDDLVERP